MKRQKAQKLTKHHIIPRSRKEKGIVGVCMVEHKIHDLSHQLFGNMTPEEIVEWLNHTLWKDCYEIVISKQKGD